MDSLHLNKKKKLSQQLTKTTHLTIIGLVETEFISDNIIRRERGSFKVQNLMVVN